MELGKVTRSIWVGATIALAAVGGTSVRAGLACPGKPGSPPVWKTLPPTPVLPQPERQGRIPVEGSRIWYGEYGAGHGGTPVVLLHGGLASSAYYGRLVPELVAAGYHVVAIDSRGHGRSAGSTLPYSYELMARDVVTVLDRLRIARVDVVGWSDGGTIGYMLALSHPDRLRRLFAFGANARLDGLKPGYASTPTFTAYLERTKREYPRAVAYDAFVTSISHMWDTAPTISDARLATIPTAVTIAVAQHDEALKVGHARHIAAVIPRGRLVILPDVSHFAMLQCAREFDATILAYLRSSK